MADVEVAGSELFPQLGFGTASVLGGVGRRRSQGAIRQAYRLGIRHFDTARLYGWGEAEGVLAKTLAPFPRASYTLVSKCGLVPTRRSWALSFAKSVARMVIRAAPPARRLVRSIASTGAFQPTATYDIRTLEQSVATSLAESKTSYLDVLLLHNFETGKAGLPEVVSFLRELKRRGVVRRFGYSVEGDLHAGLDFLAAHDALDGAVVQVPISAALLELPDDFKQLSYIAHSPIRYLSKQARPITQDSMRALFLEVANACRCEAIVCSMYSSAHLRENIAARNTALDQYTRPSG